MGIIYRVIKIVGLYPIKKKVKLHDFSEDQILDKFPNGKLHKQK